MAADERHAAWQDQRSYAVTVVPEDREPIELAAGLSDFLEAVDVASEWLEREDPGREGTTGIAIHELRAGGSAEVWRYPSPDRPAHDRPLVDTFGFDPVGWVPAVREFVAERPLPSPARGRPASERHTPEPEGPDSRRLRLPDIRPFARAAWDDLASRACLIVGGVSLWLTLTLLDARFLALLLLALTGLGWRRGSALARATSDEDLL